jgi:hypothetical protein
MPPQKIPAADVLAVIIQSIAASPVRDSYSYAAVLENTDNRAVIVRALNRELNARELATVLAALRYWQGHCSAFTKPLPNEADLSEIANDGGTLEPLTTDEIDALCERLNQ